MIMGIFKKIRYPPEWGIKPVPPELKILRGIDYFVLWSSLAIGLLVMQAGALLTSPDFLNLDIYSATIISIIGSIIGSLMLAAAGVVGSRHGVPTMVSLRPAFGRMGSYIPTILNIIQLIGWTTFELIIMGEAATALTGEFLGIYTRYFWMTIIGIWCYLLASLGPLTVVRQWMEKFAIWLVYITTIYLSIQVFREPTIWTHQLGGSISSSLLALDLVVAMPISWMPLISDYNRFSIKDKSAFIGTFSGYTLANSWFYILGAALIILYPGETIVYSIALLMLGSIALLVILVDETDNAFADIYSAALSIQNLFPKFSQRKLALLITIISLILAYTIPIMQYETFLLLIGASFIPIFAILITDYFILKNVSKYDSWEKYINAPKLRASAVISWVLGFIIYNYFVNTPYGASIPTFILTLIIYYILEKIRAFL